MAHRPLLTRPEPGWGELRPAHAPTATVCARPGPGLPETGAVADTLSAHSRRQGADRHAYRDARGLRADARPRQGAWLRLPGDQRDLEPDPERRAAGVRRRRKRWDRPDLHRRRRIPLRPGR